MRAEKKAAVSAVETVDSSVLLLAASLAARMAVHLAARLAFQRADWRGVHLADCSAGMMACSMVEWTAGYLDALTAVCLVGRLVTVRAGLTDSKMAEPKVCLLAFH